MLRREMVLMSLFLVIVATVAGCAKGTDSGLIDVRGHVDFDGTPVRQGTIAFLTADNSNVFSGNVKEGQFTIGNSETGVGIPPGKYHVTVMAWEIAPGMGQAGKEAIPKKYFSAQTSGLEAVVSPEHVEHDFDLRP